jgi:U3 small nucleolar ribonucleoprotein protein LCP5
MHSLTLLLVQRVAGHSLKSHTPPSQPFSSSERDLRGVEAGDLVDALVEERLVLEKIQTLEKRMKYQINKYVRLAEDNSNANGATVANEGNAPYFLYLTPC